MAVDDSEILRTAAATDIRANQDLLATAFVALRQRLPHRDIVFDGHSLIDNDEGLVVVPISTFVALSPDIIVFLEDDPEHIVSRRLADRERPRPPRSATEIATQQNTAKEAALSYGAALSVPCIIVRSEDSPAFNSALEQAFHRSP